MLIQKDLLDRVSLVNQWDLLHQAGLLGLSRQAGQLLLRDLEDLLGLLNPGYQNHRL
jgi:hypothetical protein